MAPALNPTGLCESDRYAIAIVGHMEGHQTRAQHTTLDELRSLLALSRVNVPYVEQVMVDDEAYWRLTKRGLEAYEHIRHERVQVQIRVRE